MGYAGLKGAAIGGASVLLLAGGGVWLLANTLTHGPKTATAYVEQRHGDEIPPAVDTRAKTAPAEVSADVLFAAHSPAVVRVIARSIDFGGMLGSGFFISKDGLLVTNYHVIRGAEIISVIRADNTTLFVEGIVAQDKAADLALLKINVSGVPFLPIGAEEAPKIGTKVYAIGNPDGLTNTLSEGLISGLRNQGDRLVAIQTSAAISHGSSGGPLLTSDGMVVGVTAAMMTNGQNLNFAVPAAQVRQLIASTSEMQRLVTAGMAPLNASQTEEFAGVWTAMDRKQFASALRLLNLLPVAHRETVMYWLVAGFLNNQLNNSALAIEAYQSALQIDPDLELGWYGLGVSYAKAGQNAAAIDAFKSAAKAKPRDTRAYEGAGFASASVNDFNKALAFFKKAAEISPEDPAAYAGIGLSYGGQKRYADAVAACQKAIAIKPNFAYAYIPLGMAYMEMGRRPEAMTAWQNAFGFDPHGPVGQAALLMLRHYSKVNNR